MDLEQLKYPTGKYQPPHPIEEATVESWISTIKNLPESLRKQVENLSYESLDWIYRPGGWTIKQVVHHIADSHMNAFVRFKLAMTQETPSILPYLEGEWAKLADGDNFEIKHSLEILEGLHARMVLLFESMTSADWEREMYHPEYQKNLSLGWVLGLYAWHSEHHLAHIKQAIEKEGNFVWED